MPGSSSQAPQVVPLSTPPPAAVAALATQPSAAFAVPTNVPTAAMSAYPEDNLVGKTLAGRYSISKKLGEGGMGSVYLATHVVLEKQVALKVLHGEYARKPDLVERFMQEAKAASRIRHENVIDISDFGATEDGLVFFAMELLKGNDLHELIARARLDGEVLPWDRSRHIFLQICAALAAAHSHGIVHRDLKPENVYLIDFLGRPDFVKLLDFGIAKLAENDGGERKLTRTGMLFGTPEYMSPEQARGDKVDHRVDIYAMACILFQLVTGRVPFEAENFMGVLSLHLTEPPPEIPAAALERCGAPPQLAAIIAKGLCKNRDERWQTIEEMANAIRAMDAPGALDHPVALELPVKGGRVKTQWTGTPQVPLVEQPRAGRSKAPLWIAGAVLLAGGAVATVLALRPAGGGAPSQPTPGASATGAATPDVGTSGGATAVAAPGAGAASTPSPADDPAAAPTTDPAAGGPVALPPPTAPPPAPLPDKVKITFVLPRGITLYDPAGKAVGKGKTVVLELAGSDTALSYTARGKGLRERIVAVTPDRDDRIEIALDREGERPRSAAEGGSASTGSAGGPAVTPTSPTPTPPGPEVPPGPEDPSLDDPPTIKDPFKSGKAPGAEAKAP